VGGLDGVLGLRQPGGRTPHRLAVPRPRAATPTSPWAGSSSPGSTA
jgi:hypothetical protein